MNDQVKTIQTKMEDDLSETKTSELKTEQIRDRQIYTPSTDIYETKDELVLVMDVPGADESSVQVTLEKNVLTINAYPAYGKFEGYTLAYAEFGEGDYQRSFALSNEIDQTRIEAKVKNGVLTLHLAKTREVKPHKISVKVG
jgi:HSP20 family molecular chaperone IbpA